VIEIPPSYASNEITTNGTIGFSRMFDLIDTHTTTFVQKSSSTTRLCLASTGSTYIGTY